MRVIMVAILACMLISCGKEATKDRVEYIEQPPMGIRPERLEYCLNLYQGALLTPFVRRAIAECSCD